MVKIRKFFEASQSWEKLDTSNSWNLRSEKFTDYEIRKLKELFPDRNPIKRDLQGNGDESVWLSIKELRLYNIMTPHHQRTAPKNFADRPTFLMISKYEDDWFLCQREGKYEFYKCDQFNGLIEFINWFFETKQYLV
jgi:hypothetical protein